MEGTSGLQASASGLGGDHSLASKMEVSDFQRTLSSQAGVPPPDAEAVAGRWGSMGAESVACSPTPRVSLRDELDVLRVLSISWISSLYHSTSLLLYSMCDVFALCLIVRSISYIILELLGMEVKRAMTGRRTLPNPRVPSLWIC